MSALQTLSVPASLRDYERLTGERVLSGDLLSPLVWQWLSDAGGEGWETVASNVRGFDDFALRPRVLVDISERDLTTTVLGTEISMPVMIAPAGTHQNMHADGELATARAAAKAGIVMGLSTCSSYTIEEVAAASSGPRWFQLYFMRDRPFTERLIRRAEESGYSAVILTVDNPPPSVGRIVSNQADAPAPTTTPWWALATDRPSLLESDRVMCNFRDMGPGVQTYDKTNWVGARELRLTWRDVEWLREITDLPIVVKGVQAGEDAALAAQHGAAAVVVSNHGGWALKQSRPTIAALPEVVEAAAGQIEVYVDGGVRRGTDVLKALALGSRAVLIARPVYWALAVGGEHGVTHMLSLLRDEIDEAMVYCGVPALSRIDPSLVTVSGSTGTAVTVPAG